MIIDNCSHWAFLLLLGKIPNLLAPIVALAEVAPSDSGLDIKQVVEVAVAIIPQPGVILLFALITQPNQEESVF